MAAVRDHLLLFITISLFTVSHSLSDIEGLLKLKNSFTNADALNSWNPNSYPCKNQWLGIVCTDSFIIGIHLSDMGLSGTIDIESLQAIRSLRTISFTNNSFSGPLPEFNKLGALKSLLLSFNQFSGEIPTDYFSKMSSLKKVWLDNNKFTGKIPDSVLQLPHLKELHLEGNQFSGSVDPLKNPQILTSLDLSSNLLEGQIPDSYAKFSAASFAKNDKLCGKPLDKDCAAVNAQASEINQSSYKSSGGKTKVIVFVAIAFVLVFFVLLSLLSARHQNDNFSMLKKDEFNDVEEVPVPQTTTQRPPDSSRKGGGDSTRRVSNHGRSGVSDLTMVNDEMGIFGLPDLMKAAAEVLGNSGLGSAYKAVMGNGLSVVVKRMREMNRIGRDGFDTEMRRFGRLNHRNILTPLAYHYRREEKLMVSEFMPKGSLLFVLHGDRGNCHADLNWPTRLKIIKGLASGLSYLHQEFATYELPHGNLKSSNVLLNDNYEPLLADYALHPLINPNNAAQAMFAFKCPEYVQYQQLSHKSDVYCFGIIILEILTGKFPSQYLSNGKGGTDVVQWVHSAISENKGVELIDPEIASNTNSLNQMVRLLQIGASCTESNAEKRLDLKEVMRRIEMVQI
ncbi:Pkinase_Tyr domain-containing protein/LRRNT_2 domain-containing protein/LRR_8 domain-containing protein [Cephalotus follicularis]|uniref:Pkinase_Tyr domain-containing protein/LRRNT_2 domain-containing protein/LRR_8 domain-containing protein n=1 Tax=Cephalotus follicularis TaxID=3775 RepID=A0A1Q3C826_CEPFO|nr:Pkinase_Tyr domain-containing protein/LRRNT_2 domain-containing protein/LRR_8 domain-containing protein [Cephalotus follicularis]